MAEYIDRQAVMNKFAEVVAPSNNSDFARVPSWNDAVDIVENFPPADVWPVLRCRDCFANGSCIVQDALFDNDLDKAADFYCAYGRIGKDGEVG